MMHYTEIRFFVLFYKLKNTFVTPLHLSSGFQHEIEHALSGAGIWHQKIWHQKSVID